mmetsp:Transcript_37346/g.87106  ORF Transcript_37346/g.87106 Transcript_37346/m.87106 type:complete len:93 (+) Transcript_37346:117-395(+)
MSRAVRIESGEDWWVLVEEQEEVREREKERKTGVVQDEGLLKKLKGEIVGPYVDNHTGWITIGILGLVVVCKFLLPQGALDGVMIENILRDL